VEDNQNVVGKALPGLPSLDITTGQTGTEQRIPLVAVTGDVIVSPAVPIEAGKRRKSMSRRIGQNGTVEVRNGAYRGRWFEDVVGQSQRVKRSVVLGFVKEMRKSEARRKLRSIIEATGANSPSYVIPSSDIFAKRVPWWEENYLSRQKPSTQRTMRYHVRKYLRPKWDRHPLDCITADKVNEWIGELSHLSPMSQKHVVATLCLILKRRFGRKKITYSPSWKSNRKLSATRQKKWQASLPTLRVCGKFYLPLPLRLVQGQANFTGLKGLTLILPEA